MHLKLVESFFFSHIFSSFNGGIYNAQEKIIFWKGLSPSRIEMSFSSVRSGVEFYRIYSKLSSESQLLSGDCGL